MRYKLADKKPDGKYNCICHLDNGETKACYWHVKKQCFFDHYDDNKQLDGVAEWEYAIVRKRHSSDFEEFMVQMMLENGDIVAKNHFANLPEFRQKRLVEEVQLIDTAIKMYYEKG